VEQCHGPFLRVGRPEIVTEIVTAIYPWLYRIAMASRLRIEILGPVRVELDGAPLVVDTRKAIALLAFLAVTGRRASRETLAALLWPESDEAGAHGALRRTLSVLKAALGGVGLVIDRGSVAFRPDELEVDVWRFRAALARVRGHDHGPNGICRECLHVLDEAIALDRGEFMAGFALRSSEAFDDWQSAEAEAHRRELTGALERLARGRAAESSWEAAIAAARRWLEFDGLHEPAQRLLMSALAAAGESGAALRQYRECVRTLDRELGVAPLAETTALAEAIRDGRFATSSRPDQDADASGPASRQVSMSMAPPFVSPLVGRDEELAALLAGYEAAGPDGRLLLVEGEAGIGKTCLSAALADRIRARGGTVLAAEVYGGETGISFAPIAELIRAGVGHPDGATRLKTVRSDLLREAARLVPLLHGAPGPTPAAPGDPFGRARLFEALAEVLVALTDGPRPGLLWVDDLHRADASTIELVGYLARRLRTRPVALLISWRPEDLAPGVRDQILVAAERDGLAVCVDLPRLDRAQVEALATATLGRPVETALADSLFERSEGLPLYVAEALAAPDRSDEGMPDGVVALLGARIDATSAVAGQILSAAAVIGRSFDLVTVQAASGRTDNETVDGLDELVRRRLIREGALDNHGDVRYDFTHGRLRDVAYGRLSLARRRLLHARVADALARSAGGSGVGRWSVIAHHQALAGRSAQAADAHREAGDYARSVFANAEAREHLEAALALGHPAVAELHEALGEVLTLLGDYDGALAHLETALGLVGPEEEARLDHRLAMVLARIGDRARADRYLVAALVALGPGGDLGIRAEILVDRSGIAHRDGDPQRAEAFAREALSLGQAAEDPTAMARAQDLLGIVARGRGDLTAAYEHLEGAIAAADRADDLPPSRRKDARATSDPGVRIAALNTLALVCADAGDRARAIELTRDALLRCARQGDRHRQAALENNLADLLHTEGQADEAMVHLKLAVALFAEIGGRPGDLQPEIWKLVEW
jgi:DNA-binding SARP family transcriptional activator/tetratricopeptide (TPR) repeat protein